MKKIFLEKKRELFKELFPDYKISESGSMYCLKNPVKSTRTYVVSGFNVTKNTFANIGSKKEYPETSFQYIAMLTKTGSLLVKQSSDKYFKKVSLKNSAHCLDLISIFKIGKKYEWLLEDEKRHLWSYFNFFKSFNSLKEAKNLLGFEFINDVKFLNLFSKFNDWGVDVLKVIYYSKDRSDIVHLFDKLNRDNLHLLTDYIRMCEEEDLEIIIPRGVNRLEELHDNTVLYINKKQIDLISDEVEWIAEEEFTKVWLERGLAFRKLASKRDMFKTGILQSHCIGSYMNRLSDRSFYSFSFGGVDYEIMISPNDGYVQQFFGRRNCTPPKELVTLATKDINLKHKIKAVETLSLAC